MKHTPRRKVYPLRKAGLVRVIVTAPVLMAILTAAVVYFHPQIQRLADISLRLPGVVYGGYGLVMLMCLAALVVNVYRLLAGVPALILSDQGLRPMNGRLIPWRRVEQVVNYRGESLGIIPTDRAEMLAGLGFGSRLLASIKDRSRPPVEIFALYLPCPIDDVLEDVETFRPGITSGDAGEDR